MTTPLEVFDQIRDKGMLMLQTAFMESGKAWPEADVVEGLLKPVLGIGIAAASEYFATHPERLAVAHQPICTECREPVQSWQGTIDPTRDGDGIGMVRVAWPCGHVQKD